jgi:hypothetical protein
MLVRLVLEAQPERLRTARARTEARRREESRSGADMDDLRAV